MMQTGIARHTSAVVLPYGLVAVLAFNIFYRTYLCALAAPDTLVGIDREMLVGDKIVMEETAKKAAIEAWQQAFVEMLTTATLANPFGESIQFYGSITNFFTFTKFLVEVHEGESDVALRHDDGV